MYTTARVIGKRFIHHHGFTVIRPPIPEHPATSSNSVYNQDGAYLRIPLNLVYSDSSATIKADRRPLYSTHQAIVDRLREQLITPSVLTSGTEPLFRVTPPSVADMCWLSRNSTIPQVDLLGILR
jgi:hypothetical protein